MKEYFQKINKDLPLAIFILVFILFLAVRPTFNTPKLASVYQSIAEQYFQHTGEKSKKIHGIDVSHDQGNINWSQVMTDDIDFVYLKATDGITYTDPLFHEYMSVLRDQELLYGAYHFFETEDDPEKQAQNFLQQISDYPLRLAPMVDVEVTKEQKPEEIKARLQVFLNKVHSATGCSPIIYSYNSFWQSNIGSEFNQYMFWLADYAKKMNAPKGVNNLTIWQYSEKGQVKGISGLVDLDVVITGQKGLSKMSCTGKVKA